MEQYEELLIENDREFIQNVNQNQDNQNNIDIVEEPAHIYNPSLFQIEIIIKYLQNNGIFQKTIYCEKCGSNYKLSKDNQIIDKYVWRCRGNMPKHDIKINIRKNSILEGIHINLQILYFLYFIVLLKIKVQTKLWGEIEDFTKQLGI